jgi:hypothetical protein
VEEVTFDCWWAEFLQRMERDREDGYDAARRLRDFYIPQLSNRKRQAFLDELLGVAIDSRPGAAFALHLLEDQAQERHTAAIAEHVAPLPPPGSHQAEERICNLMRVLASDRSCAFRDLVEEYLLRRKIGPHWDRLPWALWPHDPNLFARAHKRYFIEVPAAEWKHTAIVGAFLHHADAIGLVRDQLLPRAEGAWSEFREAISAQLQAGFGWTSGVDREAVVNAIQPASR